MNRWRDQAWHAPCCGWKGEEVDVYEMGRAGVGVMAERVRELERRNAELERLVRDIWEAEETDWQIPWDVKVELQERMKALGIEVG